MGWLFTQGASKTDVIRELTRDQSTDERVYRTLRKCLRGNTMYALHESGPVGETEKWLCVYMLGSERDFGWGYKAVDESMGPVHRDCPASYLDEADEPPNEYAREWREACRANAARRKAQAAKRPEPGERWSCRGRSCKEIRIVSVEGRRFVARNVADGQLYRIPKKILGEKLPDEGNSATVTPVPEA